MESTLNYFAAIGLGINDYIQMFALTPTELEMNILDCYPGISAFSAQMAKKQRVVAMDPIYSKSLEELQNLMKLCQQKLLRDIDKYPERFTLNKKQAEEKIENHQQEVEHFLKDFPSGFKEGRYISAAFPQLPFKDEQFDLALVNHFLFTQSDKLTIEFHVQSIQELTRVANEVRIFPLVTQLGEISFVGEIAAKLQMLNLGVEIKGVPSQFQKQDNALMRVWNPSCSVSRTVWSK